MRPLVLLDYIDALSPQAAVWRAIDPDVRWGMEPMLLAALIDEVRVLRYEFERVNFKGKPTVPEPIVRPGVTAPGDTKRTVHGAGEGFESIEAFDAWYAQVRANQQPEAASG